MEAEIITYTLPLYWASALINGDLSGLEENEIDELDRFLERESNPYFVDVSEETWFSWSNDANRLGGDVAEFKAIA